MTGRSLHRVDAGAFRRWCRLAHGGLVRARAGIDALNVFPVADADTGTNMSLTVQAVVEALDGLGPDAADLATLARTAAEASLWGARGSSGAILSQYLHGVADVLAEPPAGAGGADGPTMQRALSRAADAAYVAVAEPMEGTILSVARAAAKAAGAAEGADLASVLRAATAGAREELALTPTQLPLLAASGVVDAGGQGLVVVLDALRAVVEGDERVAEVVVPAGAGRRDGVPPVEDAPGFGYEVQYLLDAPDDEVDRLRDVLSGLGDTVTIVRGASVHNVHVHVDDVGAAIEAGIDAGRPHRIRVTRFADQTACPATTEASRPAPRVVALCPPGGLAALFRQAGAAVVEIGEDVPDALQLATAVGRVPVDQTVLLPNSRVLRELVDTVAADLRRSGRTVTVVPTRSPLQGLAAVAVHDAARRFDDDVVAMSTAAAATRYGEIVRSVTDAFTSAGPCRAGDVLGLIDDDVAVIGPDVPDVARSVLDRLLIGGGELVTIVCGDDVPADLGPELATFVAAARPAVEVMHYADGIPGSRILVGVE